MDRINPLISCHEDSRPKGHVVLIHGLAMNSWAMWLLEKRLRASGYEVDNWGYWSVGQSLERLVSEFEEWLGGVREQLHDQSRLHVVGHSLGSIIARAALCEVQPPELSRMVMLSPPNAGSHVARSVGRHLRWLSPLVEELADGDQGTVCSLPKDVNAEVGVIAAAWDYVVREESTHLDCEADHIVLPSRHSGLILRRTVAEQIVHFLDFGVFHRESCTVCRLTAPEPARWAASSDRPARNDQRENIP